MKSLKTAIKTLIIIALVTPLAIVGAAWSGIYNVAATDEHWPMTRWLLDIAVRRSVALRADDIAVPDLSGRAQLLAGANDYEAMCAGCHAPPGGTQSAVAKGLYPAPPDLARSAEHMDAAELFWVVKHGIKASGMPAWGSTHDDEALWNIVALVEQFPGMTGERYQALKVAAKGRGGHHGGGGDGHGHGESHGQRHEKHSGGRHGAKEAGTGDHRAAEYASDSNKEEHEHRDGRDDHAH